MTPLVAKLDAYDELSQALAALARQQDALPFFFADRTRSLLDAALARLDARLTTLDQSWKHRRARSACLRETEGRSRSR